MTTPAWVPHVTGKKHLKRATEMRVSPDVTPHQATTTLQFAFCEVCNLQMEHDMWAQHTQTRRHKGRETFMQYRAVLDEAEEDKNGLLVEGGQDLGYLDPASTQGNISFRVSIKSNLPFGKSELREAKLLSEHGSRTVTSSFSVQSGTFDVAITSARPGFVVVGNEEEHEALRPKIPYTPRPKTAREVIKTTVKGVAPPATNAIPYVGALPRAMPPAQLLVVLNGSEPIKKQVDHIKRVHLPRDLSSATYARHFKILLWVEEQKAEADLEKYDMSAVSLEKHNRYY
ncbi:hypothetical protein BKA70DRAFT_1221656 [Coprinopsis sp. MPI-PUGE-AT-0042]|nr:hypothetical protein BKA70DRAFT_1221656 [Coprinopsis sp. MPI-PUGE-AT-0042]